MTRDEAIEEACSIMALAYHSIGDYSKPSDGFCGKCPAVATDGAWNFQNAGAALDYVRAAVLLKLGYDGIDVSPGCDVLPYAARKAAAHE